MAFKLDLERRSNSDECHTCENRFDSKCCRQHCERFPAHEYNIMIPEQKNLKQALPNDTCLSWDLSLSEDCPYGSQETTSTKAIPIYNRANKPESKASKTRDKREYMKAQSVYSSPKTSTEAGTAANDHNKEHYDISHLLFVIDIQIHNILKGSTSDLPYSLSHSDLLAISQALEDIKDLKEHLGYYMDFHHQPDTATRISPECQRHTTDTANKCEQTTNSTMDALFKIAADQEAEIERLTRESKTLREQTDKLTESNESLVKQNISLRRETRDLRNASICIMPLVPPPPPPPPLPTPKDVNSQAQQISKKMSDPPPKESCSIPAQQPTSSPSPRPLPNTPRTTIIAKLIDKIAKLLSSKRAGKPSSSKLPLAQSCKIKGPRERRLMSRNPSKLTKKRMSSNEETVPKSSNTSSSARQENSRLETPSQEADVNDAFDAGILLYLATRDRECRLTLFMLMSLGEHLEVQREISVQELRQGILLDLESYCSVCLTDPALLECFDRAFEEAIEFLELHRTVDGMISRWAS